MSSDESNEAVIDMGSCRWNSEADYDSDGELLCVCCPPQEPTLPVDTSVDDEPTLEDSVRWYEAERSARHDLYAKWCFEAMIRLASLTLHTDDDGRAAFVLLPDYALVTACVNDLIARGFQGTGEPPKM